MSRLFSQTMLRAAVRSLPQQPSIARSFSSLPSLRPTLPGASSSSIFRPSCANLLSRLPAATPTASSPSASGAALDLVPKTSISAHPALGSMQIRCGPRPNMNRPSRLIQKRRHGFLSRIRTNKGIKTLKRRKAKGRKRLSY